MAVPVSIVASIRRCHRRDRGSIPRQEGFFAYFYRRRVRCHCLVHPFIPFVSVVVVSFVAVVVVTVLLRRLAQRAARAL